MEEKNPLPPYGPARRQIIEESFRAKLVEAVPVPWSYRASLLAVTFVMLLLPVIYLVLIGMVGWGTYYHATHHLSWFSSIGSKRLAFLAYASPLFAGFTMVFFMVKPLFSARHHGGEARTLRSQEEPLLFHFVGRVAEAVGASKPVEIRVDSEVNASASFRRGLVSFFGDDLVLTLGLPLVGGLSLEQFGGVLAHEFGHFAQGGGMRLTYVVRAINAWFYRVVYERDHFDDELESSSENGGCYWVVLVMAAQILVGLSRLILKGLMYFGHFVSCLMLRHMEYDADRYETRLVGPKTFESTCRELRYLSVANQITMQDLQAFWREGKLSRSLPALIRLNRKELNPEICEALDRSLREESTGRFDTHPSDRDRIFSSRREEASPIFVSSSRAVDLFRDFPGLAKEASLRFYREVLGPDLREESLLDMGEIVQEKEEDRTLTDALEIYCGPLLNLYRAFPPIRPQPEKSTEALVRDLREAHATLQERGPVVMGAVQDILQALEKDREIRQAMLLHELNIAVGSDTFSQNLETASATMGQRRGLDGFLKRRDESLIEGQDLLVQRLNAALGLVLNERRWGQFGRDWGWAQKMKSWIDVLNDLSCHFEAVRLLGHLKVELDVLGHLLGEGRDPELLILPVNERMKRAHSLLVEVTDMGGQYPFDHRDGRKKLSKFLVSQSFDWQEPATIMMAMEELEDGFFTVYRRLLGQMAMVAMEVETAAGLDPKVIDFKLTKKQG